MAASLEEFSDLSHAEQSNQFDIVRHKLQLATQIFSGNGDKAAIAVASHPLDQCTVSKNSSALKMKHHFLPVFAYSASVPTSTIMCSDVVSPT